jgi:general secretion pathway protein M
MNAFWQGLEPSQQGWLTVLGGVILLTLAYVGIWEPLSLSRDAKRSEVAYHQATLDWFGQMEDDWLALQANKASSRLTANQSLLSVADQTARASGLAGSLTRIEPVNDNQVNVWLDGASFDQVMVWLSELSLEWGIRVDQLTVNQASDALTVDVRVNLAVDR